MAADTEIDGNRRKTNMKCIFTTFHSRATVKHIVGRCCCTNIRGTYRYVKSALCATKT